MDTFIPSTMPKSTDFARLPRFSKNPGALPFSFKIGTRAVSGIPGSFSPKITQEDEMTTVVGIDPETGIKVTFSLREYADFPAYEWVVWLENTSDHPTPIVSDLFAAQLTLPAKDPVLHACNGDGNGGHGYMTKQIALNDLEAPFHTQPCGGRPTGGSFPYFTVIGSNISYHLVIGWSGQWSADFGKTEGGFTFDSKQYHTNFFLLPGEKVRTPITLLFAFEGDIDRARNLWRRYYFTHIMPHPYESFPEPLVFCHEADVPGPEWVNATGDGQMRCLKGFLDRGVKFNAWWIDAGWFPCHGDWGNTGIWKPNPRNFPQGMKPLSDLCAENGIKFLLWFEPERTRMPSRDPNWKDEWLLDWVRINGEGEEEISYQYLFDLGNDEARAYMTDVIDENIKTSGVHIFRSDFNILPWGHWTCNEKWNRRGITENKYVLGYLSFWKDLAARNPGVLFDACASGGQRNDLETMRLSVPLQYTDCGIGANEPYKVAFSRTLFGWLPYFRQHSGYWDGNMDNYAYHLAICPAQTFLFKHQAPQSTIDYTIKMDPIRERAARIMLKDDYYPLAPDSRSPRSFYAVQFHDEATNTGLVHVIRHAENENDTIAVFPKDIKEDLTYSIESPEFEVAYAISGKDLIEKGLSFTIPRRAGEIVFYAPIQ